MKCIELIMTKGEIADMRQFRREHKCAMQEIEKKCAITGLFSYHLFPNSIGCAIEIRCECGEKKDVTDYKSW